MALGFKAEDIERSVREDIQYLKDHPLILDNSEISGWVYDVKDGKLTEVM